MSSISFVAPFVPETFRRVNFFLDIFLQASKMRGKGVHPLMTRPEQQYVSSLEADRNRWRHAYFEQQYYTKAFAAAFVVAFSLLCLALVVIWS